MLDSVGFFLNFRPIWPDFTHSLHYRSERVRSYLEKKKKKSKISRDSPTRGDSIVVSDKFDLSQIMTHFPG